MAEAKRDQNSVTTLLAVSNADGVTPVVLYADPTTHRLLISSTVGNLDDIGDVVMTSEAQGDVLYFNGTNWVNLAAGDSGKFLKTQGAGANPTWDTPTLTITGTDTQVMFFDGANTPAGDAGMTYNKSTNVLTAGGLALGAGNLTMTGSIAATGSRVTKGWFTNIESTNMPTVGGTAILSSLTAPQFTTIELGHATDTTLSRVSAGVVAIEGVSILTTAGGTLTGNIIFGENTSVVHDNALSADGKYTGETIDGTAGATLAFGDLVYLDPTDSRWELADANAASAADGDSRGILGICVLAAGADGNATKILLRGMVRADAAFPTLTVNAPSYVSETAGDITETQPTTTDVVIRVVGFGFDANTLYFCPSSDYITHT